VQLSTLEELRLISEHDQLLNNHRLKEAGGLERLATESRDTGRIALLLMFSLTL